MAKGAICGPGSRPSLPRNKLANDDSVYPETGSQARSPELVYNADEGNEMVAEEGSVSADMVAFKLKNRNLMAEPNAEPEYVLRGQETIQVKRNSPATAKNDPGDQDQGNQQVQCLIKTISSARQKSESDNFGSGSENFGSMHEHERDRRQFMGSFASFIKNVDVNYAGAGAESGKVDFC